MRTMKQRVKVHQIDGTPTRHRRTRQRTTGVLALSLGAVALGLSLMFVPTAASGATAVPFEYTGDNGPGFWAELNTPDWQACDDDGQSPINIGRAASDPSLAALALDLHETPMHLTNNGHTIEQEYEEGSTLTLGDVEFELIQFHFHTLSEHTVRGQRSPMEMHAVFRDPVSGNLAVVGTLFRIGGASNFLDELIAAGLPRYEDDTSTTGVIDVADVLTSGRTRRYYTYSGSLTTPPCSEIVTWLVLKRTATMSPAQFHAFQDIMGNNFRPIQARNGRVVRATTP